MCSRLKPGHRIQHNFGIVHKRKNLRRKHFSTVIKIRAAAPLALIPSRTVRRDPDSVFHQNTHRLLPEKRSGVGVDKTHLHNDLLHALVRDIASPVFQVLLYDFLRRPVWMVHQLRQHIPCHLLSIHFRDGRQIRYHFCHRINRKRSGIQNVNPSLCKQLVPVPQLHARMRKEIHLSDVLKIPADVLYMITVRAEHDRRLRCQTQRFLIVKRMIHQNVEVRDAVIFPDISGPTLLYTRIVLPYALCRRRHLHIQIVSQIIKCHT